MKRVFYFLTGLLCVPGIAGVYAQKQGQAAVDSLKNELAKVEQCKKTAGRAGDALADSTKALLLYNIAQAYCFIPKVADTIVAYYTQQAATLSEKIGYNKGMGLCYNLLASLNLQKDNGASEMEYYQKSISAYEQIKDTASIINVYANIAETYQQQGNYAEALKNLFISLRWSEASGNTESIYTTRVNIGNTYEAMGEHRAALKNYKVALQINYKNAADQGLDAVLENNIGASYAAIGDYKNAMDNYNDAITKNKQKDRKYYLADNIDNLADLNVLMGNYMEGIDNYLYALRLKEEVKARYSMAGTYTRLAACYEKYGEPKNGLAYANKGLALALELKATNDIKDAYNELSVINAALNNYKAAYEDGVLYKQYYDSVYNNANDRKIANLQMQSDFDRKQDSVKTEAAKKEIIAKKEMRNQENIRNSLLGGLLLVLGFAGFVVRSLRISRRQKIAIEQQKNRAERSERFKQQFLANMSHEIRTPMNAVSGMTDLLLEKGPRIDQVEYLQAISKSSDILLHIINDILDLSKIEAGKLELENIDFSLADTLKQVKDTLSYKAEEKGLQFVTNISKDAADIVMGDPYRLNQILINLGGNAIKFTERGSVEIAVKKTGETSDGSALCISVTDTGIGIPQDKVHTLFENFTQVNTSDTRKFGGTGLGLSISKQLVELQGGNISVESKEGSGTTFSFVINYKAGSAEKLHQRVEQEQHVDGSILDGLRILVADDNEYNRLVVNETLRLKANVHIDLVVNGREAVQLLQENDYDVILMDVQMPVMNGIEATQYIRSNMLAPKNTIPIVALTASILRADLDMCSESGMTSYIPKPFKAWQLVHTIADVTGRKMNPGSIKTEKYRPVLQDSNKVSDLDYLRDFCEGDEERMKKYVSLYINAVPGFKEKIANAVNAGDLEEIALHVHSFKPKWMMMGMAEARELSVVIDQQCRDNNDKVYENVKLLVAQTDKSVNELTHPN